MNLNPTVRWHRLLLSAGLVLVGTVAFILIAAITYIWAGSAPKGTSVSNPYTDRVKMIVMESGASLNNTMPRSPSQPFSPAPITEERNIYQDYPDVFGEAPPMISGVAIMTDSDNTGESAVSYYGDIIFKS